jgi:hypothetical protein
MYKKNIFISTLFLIVLIPINAFGFYFGGEKPLGLAGAYTAIADDAAAIFMNPAGLAQRRAYTVDINYQTDKVPDSKLSGISIIDSQTTSLAVGLAYYKMERDYYPALSDKEEAFALALSEMYSPNLFIGLTYKYLKQRHDTKNDDTGDFGILYRFDPQLSFALVGKNLIDTEIEEMHKLYTGGISYITKIGLGLSFDITKDDSTKAEKDITYSCGVDFLGLRGIKLRGGYMVDKIQDKKFYSFSVGYETSGFSLGYAVLRDEVDQDNIIHNFSLKMF